MTSTLDDRLAALAEAVELAQDRLPAEWAEPAAAVVRRAGQRLGLGVETTVVALAGPTGAGKSSLFNALAGRELAAVGRRRPTTSAAAAAIWGDVGGALLDWLEVPRRHHLADPELAGLVLLDLPDFDSVERTHRLEVERVIGLADLVVWVVDPQKYADAALHERYLRPLAAYAGTMAVVLNQADLLATDELAACRRDLEQVLAADGLSGLPLFSLSARSGSGLAALRRALRERVAARTAAVARLAADVSEAAAALGTGCGGGTTAGVRRGERERLLTALEEAAGVPDVVRAVDRAHRRRGALATGWPFVRWVRRLRPDPLRRLRLDDRAGEETRPSLPAPSPLQRAQVASARRALAAAAAGDAEPPWPDLVRRAATAHEEQLTDELHRAVARTDLRTGRPLWWRAAGLLQRVLAWVVVAGALWLVVLAGLAWLRVDDLLPVPKLGGVPVPSLLLCGGALAGLLLALLARALSAAGARRRARTAHRSLRRGVDDVAERLVLGPVEAELDVRERLCRAAAVAARGP